MWAKLNRTFGKLRDNLSNRQSNESNDTSPTEHLARMSRNGRAEDQHFENDELLFRRYLREHFVGNRMIDVYFPFPISLNRQKYSIPQDVIFAEDGRFDGWGVLEFRVNQVALELLHENAQYFFFPKHAPEETNYSHTETRCSHTLNHTPEINISSAAKKKYRVMLSQQDPTVRIPARK
jgi:hypothetical protein